jgi:hypothetical protein
MSQTKIEHRFADQKSWQDGLNAVPNPKWVLERELGGGKTSKYLPLAVQQALADVFFLEADVISADFQMIQNEILCTVKMSVLPNYPNAEHRIICGSGAKPIQMDSGGIPSLYPKMKKVNATEYCAPAARSAAISNALTTFGNVFGRQLGRKVSSGFNLSSNKAKKNEKK